jgi:CDP-glucose 4,6-dehydratase
MEELGMNPLFWAEKKVLITGHTGFKGSWMSLWLQQLGAEVTGYALKPNYNVNLFEVAQVNKGMNSIIGDVRDLNHLNDVVNKFNPEIIFHMAAQPLVRESYLDPVNTYETNVMGTVNILDVSRRNNSVKAIVNITTDKCYENKEWVWGYRENEKLGGYDPYSNSKACSELVTDAFRSSFFNPKTYIIHGVGVATARAGNVIGGGDWATNRLIPDLIQALKNSQIIQLRNPEATRPWQHVLEPLRGYLMLAEKLCQDGANYSEAWNFGPNEQDIKTVKWIVETLSEKLGISSSWQLAEGIHPHEALQLKLDISKAKNNLLWKPKLCIEDALSLVTDWTKLFTSGSDMWEVTNAQIRDYQHLK